MTNQQVTNFINESRLSGTSDEQIRQNLLNAGWDNTDISKGFNSLDRNKQTLSQTPKKHTRKSHFYILGVIIIILGIVYVELPLILGLIWGKDAKPPQDQDLQLTVEEIPQQQNSFYDLVKLENEIHEPPDVLDYLSGKREWDGILFEDIMAKNNQAYIHFDNASKKEKFQDPVSVRLEKTMDGKLYQILPYLRSISRLVSIKAEYLFRSGKEKEATEETLKLLKLAQQIEKTGASSLYYLTAIATKDTALERIQKIIERGGLMSEDYIALSKKLEKFYDTGAGLQTAFINEYMSYRTGIDIIASGFNPQSYNFDLPDTFHLLKERFPEVTLKNKFYFKPNQTKNLFAKKVRSDINKIQAPCGVIRDTASPPVVAEAESILKTKFTENLVGKLIYDLENLQYSVIFEKRCQRNLILAATRLLVAAKAYKIDIGNLPDSLTDLTPKYITLVPTDPFDGKSIRYSSSKKIIYSIGEDLVDSGGSKGDNWKYMADPTFNINF